MPTYISPEQLAQAKSIGALTYFRLFEPEQLVRDGQDYSTKEHDSLILSENGKWHWKSRNVGGTNAMDYLQKARGMHWQEAALLLLGRSAELPAVMAAAPPVIPPRPFQLPPKAPQSGEATAYLAGRGIDSELIQYCLEGGHIYQSDIGQHKNVVFVGRDPAGQARFATLRGTRMSEDGSRYIRDVPGSDKAFSFSLFPAGNSPRIHFFESAVDLLSYATIAKLRGMNWQEANYFSLSGVMYPDKLLARSPHIREVVLHLDNDEAGRRASAAISAKLKEQGYTVYDMVPREGKDWNDYLCLRMGLKAQERPQGEAKTAPRISEAR